ncbi:MAG: PAS domain-containing protein [Planctomycetes bacterium]|nr:PAS domain-containing protein [Planctomycetota bacterium]
MTDGGLTSTEWVTAAAIAAGLLALVALWLVERRRRCEIDRLRREADRAAERAEAQRDEITDLTVRQRVAENRRHQIEAVLNSLRDLVLVTDPYNEVVMANRSATDVLGVAASGDPACPLDQVVSDQELCRLITDTREHGTGHEYRHVEHSLRLPEPGRGEEVVFDVALTCVEEHDREGACVVTVLHDLTRERELAQLKTDFVAKASHELRTPLSSIRAYVEMLIDGEAPDDATRVEFYRIIHGEADRLGRLIDNLLDISRIEAGTMDVRPEPLRVCDVIERAVQTIAPQAEKRPITIDVRVPDPDLRVEADADMLLQVVLNILSNAVKYTPPGGAITVHAEGQELERRVEISVADTGVGIPAAALPRLFDRFYRVEDCKHMAAGSGLGLSLCDHIIETVHGGRLAVESQVGAGTTVRIGLPVAFAGRRGTAPEWGAR